MRRKRFLEWLKSKFFILCVLIAAYYLPIRKFLEGDQEPKAIVGSFIVSTFVAAVFLISLFIFDRLFRILMRRCGKEEESFVLPENAFQVRVDMIRVGVLSVIIGAVVIFLSYRLFIWNDMGSGIRFLAFTAYMVGLVVLHEGSHALGWILCGVPARTIRFGVLWKYLAPYANCSIPMSMRSYRIGLMLPLFTTGLLPLAISFWTGDLALLVASGILIAGAAGDISMFLAGIAFQSRTIVMDHPSEPAFIVLDKGNLPASV